MRAEFPIFPVKLEVEKGTALGDLQGSGSARMQMGLWLHRLSLPKAGGRW